MEVPKEIDDLVRSSGNNFHAKVAQWLSENDWHVIVSPYYMDQVQNKAREIDLIAERVLPIRDVWGRYQGEMAVRLFVECKFVPSYSVFWFAEKNLESAKKIVCTAKGFRESSHYTDAHHYISQCEKVAKLFATNAKKEQENEPFYKALNQVLSAMISMRGRPVTIPALAAGNLRPNGTLEFPVVVCSSFEKIFAVDFFAAGTPQRVSDNFQLEVDYAYLERNGSQRTSYFLIDFVEFSQLEQYSKTIVKDVELAASLLAE